MSGIAKRAEVGVMRGDDQNAAAWGGQPVEFFHGADHVGNMLDDVDGANFAKSAVAKGKGEAIEIGDDVGASVGITIDADRAGVLIDAASDV